MIIYVLTKGSYSDYHILGVTDNKERAEELQKIFSDKWEVAEIEEYDTEDLNNIRQGVKEWQVSITKKNHVILRILKSDDTPRLGYAIYERVCHYYSEYLECYDIYVNAEDEEHAVKNACDYLAKYLAEKEGL